MKLWTENDNFIMIKRWCGSLGISDRETTTETGLIVTEKNSEWILGPFLGLPGDLRLEAIPLFPLLIRSLLSPHRRVSSCLIWLQMQPQGVSIDLSAVTILHKKKNHGGMKCNQRVGTWGLVLLISGDNLFVIYNAHSILFCSWSQKKCSF
jgi:hypothetical protein